MDWEALFAFFAVVVSVLAYFRMMAAEAVTAEFFFNPGGSGENAGVIVIDNPTRRSLLLNKICIRQPTPDQVGIAPKNSEVLADLYRAYKDIGDSEDLRRADRMWKCLNCTHLNHEPFHYYGGMTGWDPEHLICQKGHFGLYSFDIDEVRDANQKGEGCPDFEAPQKLLEQVLRDRKKHEHRGDG